jgi:hypothetical protein
VLDPAAVRRIGDREERCVRIEVLIGGKRRRPIDGCVTAIARFCDCKVWIARDLLVPSYMFFGFEADTAMVGYLFSVIDRAIATAPIDFRVRHPELRGVGLRWSNKVGYGGTRGETGPTSS